MIATALGILPGAALADFETRNLRYTCELGVEIPVVYVTAPDQAIAVLVVEGAQIMLIGAPSTTGTRYDWPSDGSHYVWLSKDGDATLLWRDGATGTETPLLASCKQN